MRKFLFVLSATAVKPGETFGPVNTNITKEIPGLLPNEKELYQVRYQFFDFLSKKGYSLLMEQVIILGFYQIEA